MCTNAHLLKNEDEPPVLENGALLPQEKGTRELRDLFGEEESVSGRIGEIQFLDPKIVIT